MDYEKRYKEALEQAKKELAQSGPDSESARQIKRFFPELAESEDERIRVRDFMMKQFFRPISPDLADALADAIIKVNKIVLNKKQKEQKPSDLPAGFYYIDQDGNKYYSKEFRFNDGTFTTTMKVKEEQKSTEWSEEDKKVIRDACCWIAEYAGFLMSENKDKAEMLWKLSNKLTSLRPQPHWKPSEEQMEAFKGYIEEFQARAEAAVGGWNNFDVMIRLYEHLKKLM